MSAEVNKVIAILGGIVVFALMVGSFFFGRATKVVEEEDTRIERDTIVVRDTIREYYPQEVSSRYNRTDYRYMRIAQGITRMMWLRDTVFMVDSVLVEVPIEERTYESDEYRAVIEGFNPRLKSMEVYPRTAYINTTETIKERKHWGVSLGVQGGYGFTPKGWQPYAGVGVSFGYSF